MAWGQLPALRLKSDLEVHSITRWATEELKVVYLTHNHIPGELSTGPALGFPPIFKNGNQLQLIARRQHEMPLDEIQEGVPLEMISNRWTKRQSTEYLVMLKTLQQARMEGIWIPSVKYFYNWNGRITCALRGTPGDLGNILDIGFLSAARPQHKSPPTQTRYGSCVPEADGLW